MVIAEMPPGTAARRWGFPARNRLIAALTGATVIVEAGERSGSLITASLALGLGREVAAVPGPVVSALSAGTNCLIAEGATLVRGVQDVLDLLLGPGTRVAVDPSREPLDEGLRDLLDRIGGGCDSVAALVGGGLALDAVLGGLARLELGGHVRRTVGGRYVVAP